MATRTATCVGFELIRGDDAASSPDSLGGLYQAIVYLQNNTSSTVIGATDTLQLNLVTTIAAERRNGKTATIRGIGTKPAQNAIVGTTAYSATITLSTATAVLDPVAESDYSTGATLPANTTVTNRPYGVWCSFTEA